MSAARRLLPWAAIATLVATVAAAWFLAPSLVRGLVFFRPQIEGATTTAPEQVGPVQERVDAALAALGATESPSLARSTQQHTDRAGAWTVLHLRWELPAGTDALELGGRLRALLAAQGPAGEVYVIRGEAGEAQVRTYAGPRLATVVDLSPNLIAWPALQPAQHPQLALVLTGIDADPYAARALMEAGQPMAVALSPYSPFTLRLSRDALSTHTEVLAWAEPDATPSQSLEGVPLASGVFIACALPGDPDGEAALLAQADVYVLDGTEAGLDTRWRAALQAARVPLVRPLILGLSDPETAERRLRHAAAERGGAILALPVVAGPGALGALRAAGARGYRAAYPAEVVTMIPSVADAASTDAAGAPPR